MMPAFGLGLGLGVDATPFVTGVSTFSDFSGWSQNFSLGIEEVSFGLSKSSLSPSLIVLRSCGGGGC
jgi:hypothetical protein